MCAENQLASIQYPITFTAAAGVTSPLVLSLVLGDRAEAAFRQSMMGSRGELGVFWSNRLAGTITTVALLILFWPMLAVAWRKIRHLSGGDPDIDVK